MAARSGAAVYSMEPPGVKGGAGEDLVFTKGEMNLTSSLRTRLEAHYREDGADPDTREIASKQLDTSTLWRFLRARNDDEKLAAEVRVG